MYEIVLKKIEGVFLEIFVIEIYELIISYYSMITYLYFCELTNPIGQKNAADRNNSLQYSDMFIAI